MADIAVAPEDNAPNGDGTSEQNAGAVAADAAAARVSLPAQKKRTRNSLSLHEKAIVKIFCEQRVSECKSRGEVVPSQDALRHEVLAKFGWEVGRSTLSKIMTMEWKQLQLGAHPNPNMKRKRKPLFPQFEADLVAYISAHVSKAATSAAPRAPSGADEGDGGAAEAQPQLVESHGVRGVLTEAIILEEAQRLKQLHGIKDEELVLSVGWLARFKYRNGIRLRKGNANGGVFRQGLGLGVEGIEGHLKSSLLDSIDTRGFLPGLLSSNEAILTVGGVSPSAGVADVPQVAAPSESGATKSPSAGIDEDSLRVLYRGLPGAVPGFDAYAVGAGRASINPLGSWLDKPSVACRRLSSEPASSKDASIAVILSDIPEDIQQLRCGCDVLAPIGIAGLNVVIAGHCCIWQAYVAAAMVGADGVVTCLETDATALATALEHAPPNVDGGRFSNLRCLSLFDDQATNLAGRADLVLLGCSYQASPHKAKVLEAACSLVNEGGEVRFIELCCSRRIGGVDDAITKASTVDMANAAPRAIDSDELHRQLLSSPYVEDLRRMCLRAGFGDLRILSKKPVKLPAAAVDVDAEFFFATVRCFRISGLEDRRENYGQRASYTSSELGPTYRLDLDFLFVPAPEDCAVDSNTALILTRSWLRKYFIVQGSQSTHLGLFTLDTALI
ncbi:TPA: hypothetical protein N0F65_000204 [Lagenidium giganteum]|uniref:HTH CENPB-type domain-containing protein n=1 Tax=Lagenidium giganteum TaxID=4803 RepID=A0AAV2Y9Z8_9STRA|nr:TPA: hypothetical protein N0F65_000204 [Lagenidium giganteum]